MKRIILLTLFFSGISILSYTYNHQAGNGGDNDPKTYHFRQTNQNGYLANSAGLAIKNTDIMTYLGQTNGFALTLDGRTITDYFWNIAPEPNGISNQMWLSQNYPGFDQLRLDTTRGRIKTFPELNFKWAVNSGMALTGAATDSSHPTLIELNTYKNGVTEIVVGIVLFYNGTKYQYYTLELKYNAASAPEQAENTDSFVDIGSYAPGTHTGWKVDGPKNLHDGNHSLCKELVSDNDEYATTSKVAFGIYCPHNSDDNAGRAYGIEYDGTAFSFPDAGIVLSSTVPKKATSADISQHVAVAVNGNTTYFIATIKDTNVGSKIVARTNLGGTFSNQSFGADLTANDTGRCYDSNSIKYKTRDAYDPSIDCANNQCFMSYVQEQAAVTNCTDSPNFKSQIIGFNSSGAPDSSGGSAIQSKVVPIDGDSASIKTRPRVVVLYDGAGVSSSVVYNHIIESNGMTQIKLIPYSGSCWPRQSKYTSTGCLNQYEVTQISSTEIDVPVIDVKTRKGSGGDLYIFWTQGDQGLYPSDESDPNIGLSERLAAPARFIHFRNWRFLNVKSTAPKEAILDPIETTYVENANLSAFDWSYFRNGQATLTLAQNNSLYFSKFDGNSFSGRFSKIHKNGNPLALAMAYTSQPKLNVKGPTEGRTIVVWQEGSNLYSRAYYDAINLQTQYNLQEFGNVLTPSGEKPTTVRNNYSRPGDNRKVEIFINDQKDEDVINVSIFDRNGRLIRRIVQNQSYGSFSQPLFWDKKNEQGTLVAAGVYQVYITSNNGLQLNHPIIIVR